jgi:hypothetical protein
MFSRNNESSVTKALHWGARILSLASTFIIVLFFMGERFEISRVAVKEWVGLFLFPVCVIIGFVIAWWNEGLGGVITTASLLAFYLVYGWLLNGSVNQGWAFIVFASPGLLFLLSWLLSRSTRATPVHA